MVLEALFDSPLGIVHSPSLDMHAQAAIPPGDVAYYDPA